MLPHYRLVAAGLLCLLTRCIARPAGPVLLVGEGDNKEALMSQDFPDPAIIQDGDGQWYAFATSGNGKNIQAAKAAALEGPWTYLDRDALPNSGSWTTGRDNWAPDVRRVADGSYVMYYSGALANDGHHCVGIATAETVLGPYSPDDSPFACPIEQGGAIDPSGFLDAATGKLYVTYKIDGNSIGHGGTCNNGVAPLVPTPIMLQEVAADGRTKVGAAVQIFDRTEADGPLVEAPNIVQTDCGSYILFYSSWCYDSPQYSVNYATARSVQGPYTRAAGPLIGTGDFNLTAPGGATSVNDGGSLVLHANCPAGRCMFEANWVLNGDAVIVS